MNDNLHFGLTVRLFSDRKCFGPGVAALLRRVDEHHSLRAAAQSMEMAYSKAWSIVRVAEEEMHVKLLDSRTGGRRGGGAALTEEARRLLDAYDTCCARLNEYADRLFEENLSFLRREE